MIQITASNYFEVFPKLNFKSAPNNVQNLIKDSDELLREANAQKSTDREVQSEITAYIRNLNTWIKNGIVTIKKEAKLTASKTTKRAASKPKPETKVVAMPKPKYNIGETLTYNRGKKESYRVKITSFEFSDIYKQFVYKAENFNGVILEKELSGISKANIKTAPKPKATPKPKSTKKSLSKVESIINAVKKQKVSKISLTKEQEERYIRNESANYHTENILFLAQLTNNKVLVDAAKYAVQSNNDYGSLSPDSDKINPIVLSKIKVIEKKATPKPKATLKKKIGSNVNPFQPKRTQEAKDKAKLDKLKKELATVETQVKKNAQFKDKIAVELAKYLKANNLAQSVGLAGIPDQIKRTQSQLKFYKGILAGDKKDFKIIGQRLGIIYRTAPVRRK